MSELSPGPKAQRTILIGDVHGCLDELQELLELVGANAEDRLISVGDLICKGPNSLGVMQWAMTQENLSCVLGNHEARFLKYWRQGKIPDEKPYDRETYEQLEPAFEECMQFASSWPLYIDEPEFLVVHAGIDPRLPRLEQQRAQDLTNIRRLDDHEKTPWYEKYEGAKPIIFGHWAAPRPLLRRNAVGLDTGCVYGGSLTAWILPERRLVSVRAKRIYQEKDSWTHHLAEMEKGK
jgi:diadenosine tetraphosphatase ApaH/serine/threonine PP2A family protein phosphatase